jgi:hypothetical protein
VERRNKVTGGKKKRAKERGGKAMGRVGKRRGEESRGGEE